MTRTNDPTTIPTLFHEGLPYADEDLVIEGDELGHLRSLRLRVGDRVEVTDGLGLRRSGRVTALDRRSGAVALAEEVPLVRPPPIDVLAPVGNRDRCLWLVEKAVELGVQSIRFVEFERSRSVSDGSRTAAFVARARRRSIAALKQSGGSVLPEIDVVPDLVEALEGVPSTSIGWIADASGTPIARAAESLPREGRLTLIVGPEGGVTPEEVEACIAAGFTPVGLGPRTLRFETAAVAGLAVASARMECDRIGPAGSPADTFDNPNE
jgi:16S rRNA (uracil1498-N3)-methyltransferase